MADFQTCIGSHILVRILADAMGRPSGMKERMFTDEEAQQVAKQVHIPILVMEMLRNGELGDIFARCADHKNVSKEYLLENSWIVMPILEMEPSCPVNCRALEGLLRLVFMDSEPALVVVQRLAMDVKALLSAARRFKRMYRYESKRQNRSVEEVLAKHDPQFRIMLASISDVAEDTDSPLKADGEKEDESLLFDMAQEESLESKIQRRRQDVVEGLQDRVLEIVDSDDGDPAPRQPAMDQPEAAAGAPASGARKRIRTKGPATDAEPSSSSREKDVSQACVWLPDVLQ